MWVRRGAAWNCAGAQHARLQGALRGVALGRSMGLDWIAAWGRAGEQHAAASGRSVGLRRGAAAVRGVQRAAEQGARHSAALGRCV